MKINDPGLYEEYTTSRPAGAGVAKVLAGSLVAWVARRPLDEAKGRTRLLSHSADTRQLISVLAVLEIFVAVFVSMMIPPVLRPYHAALEVLLVVTAVAAVTAMARHPHTISDSHLTLRTGFLGELQVPREAVSSASRSLRTVNGRGLRPVPGEAHSVACSVGSSVNVAVRLDPPVTVSLGRKGVVQATEIYLSADSPEAFLRAVKTSGTP